MRARLALPAVGLLALAGCAAPPPPSPGSVSPEEAGLRMVADRAEARLKSSGRIEQRPELDAYLRGVLCRVVGPGCAELRLYLGDQPGFNATAWPNGVLELWSGTLLRLENEARLALVLGHEAAHLERHHTAQVWSRARQSIGIGALLGTLAGVPELGLAMGALAVLSYSRDREREADRLGLERLARAGYDPSVAPAVRERVLAERARSPSGAPPAFLSTHPTDAERIATLRALAAPLPGAPSADPLGRDAYRAAIAPVETWRSMGLVAKRLGREAEAREAFRTYLARAGAVADRPMIERMLVETERATRRACPLLLVLWLLVACETGPPVPVLVPAGAATVGRLQLRTDTVWTRLPAKPPRQVWTVHGPLLDQLVLLDALADGQPLVEAVEGGRGPVFRASLAGPELAEFLPDGLRASGAADAALLAIRPQPFAGGEGIRVELRHRQPESGLAMRGAAVARIRDGRLVLIQLVAAEDHHFPALSPAFERLVGSAVIA